MESGNIVGLSGTELCLYDKYGQNKQVLRIHLRVRNLLNARAAKLVHPLSWEPDL